MHSLGKLAILGGPLETWVDHITQKYLVHYITFIQREKFDKITISYYTVGTCDLGELRFSKLI